jgi:hypothetical protein
MCGKQHERHTQVHTFALGYFLKAPDYGLFLVKKPWFYEMFFELANHHAII